MLERMLDHGRLWRRVRFVLFDGLLISFLVIITTTFTLEVSRALVFVCAAILYSVSQPCVAKLVLSCRQGIHIGSERQSRECRPMRIRRASCCCQR